MLATVVFACLAVTTGQAAAVANSPDRSALAEAAKTRLSDAYLREAVMMMSPTDILPAEIEAAITLSYRAATLFPDDADRWRVVYAISSTAAATLPRAAEINREAIANLARLCPGDEVVKLRRLNGEIERRETAEGRLAAYAKLTSDDAVKVIGSRVASRLAFDQALFASRVGDSAGFAASLERSLVLSPSFPAATETAAGYIAERIDDPVAECELLVAATMANPTELRLWSRLAALLLQERAYDAAVRICRLTVDCAEAHDSYVEEIDVAISDLALALWGAGREQEAATVVEARLAENREGFIDLVTSMNPGISRSEAATIPGPVSVVLKMVDAVLCAATSTQDANARAAALIGVATEKRKQEETLSRQRASRGIAVKEDPDADERSKIEILECTIAGALLGADPKSVDDGFAAAIALGPLDSAQSAQVDAWKALARGDGEVARGAFAAITSPSVAVALGRARAALLVGDRQSAAREYLAVASQSPGTLLGLYATQSLRALIGQALPGTGSEPKLAGIIASIPSTMERYMRQELPILNFSAQPDKKVVGPFDPIWYTLTLKNVSTLTLAISARGPIREHVLLQPRLLMPGALVVDRMTPEIIAFDRAIELKPQESMTMRWNFGWTGVGYRTALHPVTGAILELRGAVNFAGDVGGFKEGAFGAPPTTTNTEVQGVRVTPEWIESAKQSAARGETDTDLVNLVLLGFAMKGKFIPEDGFAAVWKAIVEGFAKLPEEAQEWVVLSSANGVKDIATLLDVVRATTSQRVRAAYLLSYCRAPDDPQIAMAVRSGDEWAYQAALVVQARFLREAARAEERMRGQKQESSGSTRDAAQQVGVSEQPKASK